MEPVMIIARARSVRGEVVLRRRRIAAGHVDELIVNGVFAMDSAETGSERELGRTAKNADRVLLGGLGLGYTADEVLRSSVRRLDIVECEDTLIDWAKRGVTNVLQRVASDPRVRFHAGDIADVLDGRQRAGRADALSRRPRPANPDGPWDAILLDVDNGPDFLIHPQNADLYTGPLLAAACRQLAPGGVLAIWCQGTAPSLDFALRQLGDAVGVRRLHAIRGARHLEYVIYTLRKGGSREHPRYATMAVMPQDYRVERDTMGEVQVPAAALYKAQTQRAVENFPISGLPIDPALIAALGLIKGAAARVNAKLGVLDADRAVAIASAAETLAHGDHDAEFPIDVFQTGSGTSSNMNANEVIASLAATELGGPVHPNDEVNASQSSNDVFPSAIHIAATQSMIEALVPALQRLEEALSAKAKEFAEVVKSGRTHLMDATPVTLGQEFGGYAAQVRYGVERVHAVLPRVAELPLGGTAVGTGINAPAGFASAVISIIAEDTGLPLTEARDHFEAQGARDGLVEASGALRTIAVSLYKIANDLRWMGSGPTAGLREISLPDLQPGSSIMPGKVNPVICEAATMVCAQVIGNDAAVAFAGASGNFELNVMLPVMARNLLESIRLLANVSRLLADRCVAGIVADVEHCRTLAESSPSIVTPLNRYIGYENAAAVAKKALKEGKTIRQVVLECGFVAEGKLTEEQLDAALDVLAMTHPQHMKD